MTVPPTSNPQSEGFKPSLPTLPAGYGGIGGPVRPPFSKRVLVGFVIACISLFVFGFAGALGAALCLNPLASIRAGRMRGWGLAIAGIIIGMLSFILYGINYFVSRGLG